MQKEYLAIARRYRPQTFKDVLGQEAIVTTLKNGLRQQRLGHAYLFSGSRGTGKTTLARLTAKALNCEDRSADMEPCNRCGSCCEIAQGSSLDVLEIDGASHRGIDDIRQLTEGVGYAAAGGKYKIYIIDEVHMLTKEAFNGLLKTLEEPPLNVKFFFATTESHKVPATIISRCQRFQLHRIPAALIVDKLRSIVRDMRIEVEEAALQLIATFAEGGLRDAESILDQVISFRGEKISIQDVHEVLGIEPRHSFFALDRAAEAEDLNAAFRLSQELFYQGKDLHFFMEGLIEHFRTILLFSLGGEALKAIGWLPDSDRTSYQTSTRIYAREQCLAILDYLVEAQEQLKQSLSKQLTLEMILLRVIRMRQRVPIDILVKRLADFEQRLNGTLHSPSATPKIAPSVITPQKEEKAAAVSVASMQISPTPKPPIPDAPKEPAPPKTAESKLEALKKQSRYDTLLRFAAIELDGTIKT